MMMMSIWKKKIVWLIMKVSQKRLVFLVFEVDPGWGNRGLVGGLRRVWNPGVLHLVCGSLLPPLIVSHVVPRWTWTWWLRG